MRQEARTEIQSSATVAGTPHAKKAFFVLDGLEAMPQLNRSDRQFFFPRAA